MGSKVFPKGSLFYYVFYRIRYMLYIKDFRLCFGCQGADKGHGGRPVAFYFDAISFKLTEGGLAEWLRVWALEPDP